jgi:hypothetical protein
LGQTKAIYFKLESNDLSKHFCNVSLYGKSEIKVYSTELPTNYVCLPCDSSQTLTISTDCKNSPILRTSKLFYYKLSCGDSVIVNITNGSYKIVNKKRLSK